MGKTHNHLLHLLLQGSPRNNLHILQSAENFMVHGEAGFHAELSAFFDGEGVVLQIFQGTGFGQVDDDIGSAFDF